ncbi:MAG: hypothetical protein ACOCX0_04595 [Bacteroidota bacterium]
MTNSIKKINLFGLLVLLTLLSAAQNPNRVKEPDMLNTPVRREIRLPEIPGFEIIKSDFHMHTVFSDGLVWPTIRVEEAYYEGLDAIAITEHIEYRPNRELVKGDHNSAYDIAKPRADQLNILLVKAGEISRSMPPGHIIALFVDDANKLETPEYMDALKEARNQGAYIFWAHPGWDAQQPDTTLWWDEHQQMLDNDLLHGLEVFNWDEWYPIAMGWAKDKNLTWMANSDIHIVASHRFNLEKYFRPMNLVFARERTMESLKEALFERRSVALFLDNLAGPDELLQSLFHHSVAIGKPFHTNENGTRLVELKNITDLTFKLENLEPENGATPTLNLLPGSSVIMTIPATGANELKLTYKGVNMHTGMFENAIIMLDMEP